MTKKKLGFGIRGKLTIIIIIALITSIGIVGGISIFSMRAEMERQIRESQMLLAKTFSEEVQQFFDDAKGMVRTAVQMPAIRDVSSIPLISEDVMGVPRDVDVPKRDIMNYIVDNYGDFRYMEQVTADVGNNIVLEPWEYQLDLTQLDFGHREWFTKALKKMDAHVSEVYISSSLNAPVIAISHPTVDDNGNPTSVFMGALTLDRLNELSRNLTFGETGHAYMVDHRGILAAHHDESLTAEMRVALDVPMVAKAMAGETGVDLFFDPLEQQEVLSSYMPIGDTGWSMVVVQDPDEAFAPVKATMFKVITAAGVLLIVGVLLAILVANSFSHPINKLAAEVGRVAQGDLTATIDIRSKDEIGALADGFNIMVKNMEEALANINVASEQVASGSGQVSDSSMALSQGAAEQASSIEELTASLEEVSSQTKLNAEHANEANRLSELAMNNAKQGDEQMEDMLEAMENINASSSNISKIIKVIDEIAFQTNILALNAAVEAARAGQHGKGFAVVAEEVRNLAARSANAAKETTDMIEESIKRAEGGTKIAQDTAKALGEIVEGIAQAAKLVGDIAVASNEQASAIEQINQGVMQISQVVQNNSATAEESAAASEELSGQADLLRETVNQFKLKEHSQSLKGREGFQGLDFKTKERETKIKGAKDENEHKPRGVSDLDTAAASKVEIKIEENNIGKY